MNNTNQSRVYHSERVSHSPEQQRGRSSSVDCHSSLACPSSQATAWGGLEESTPQPVTGSARRFFAALRMTGPTTALNPRTDAVAHLIDTGHREHLLTWESNEYYAHPAWLRRVPGKAPRTQRTNASGLLR